MDVKVVAEGGAGDVRWTIDGKHPREAVIVAGHKTGPQSLDFKLFDRTQMGLRFNDADPIWVHETEDDQCPTGGIQSDQITVSDCEGRRLTIANANSGSPRTLHYQLNFVDGDGRAVSVDPVIKNGGGT
jgi:hypothetical protein